MSILNNKLGSVLKTSQTLLNSKFPDEFELYMCALELVSTKTGKTLSYFVFPVMPSSIEFTQNTLTNIQNTFGGVSVLSTTNFVPFDINLSGTFGRGFRFSLGQSFYDISSIVSKLDSWSGLKQLFDPKLKSGYGYCKLLETLFLESNAVDSDGQRVLYFYNLAFNQKYVVESGSITYSQDLNSNMVWNYRLTIKAVAPLSLVSTFHSDNRSYEEITQSLSKEKILTSITNKLSNIIGSIL